jgi:hypothetical protein
MSAIARRISVGLASGAMVAAATLSPVTVANADTSIAISSLGSKIGSAECEPTTTTACPPAAKLPTAAALQSANGPSEFIQSIFQNELWWIGRPNMDPPDRSPVLEFTPLSLVPGFLKPLYSWFTQNLDFEVCLLGAAVTVGPYGTTTVSVGRGCA